MWFGTWWRCGSVQDVQQTIPTKRTSNSTIRGNLVRSYQTDIEEDFYLDREHELGKGGCGVVVVGENKQTRAQYAIKIVNKATAERGRLDRELKLMKDVDHANIVRLFSVYDVPSHMYFVMELCLGGHLGNLLSRQPNKCVDEDWAKKLSRQLLSAVAHIHGRGIAHRDIKLQNILIDSTNDRNAQLKLIDFGYGSRYIGALPMKTKCGTPYTTAPEVIRECYDQRCDVWSCGVVIYIMLCGRRPFEAVDIAGPLSDAGKAAMITNILAGRFHFNHKAWQTVSRQSINFVRSLLTHDYRHRIHSHEALEHSWLKDSSILESQQRVLNSEKSVRVINKLKRSYDSTEFQRTGMVALVFGIQSRAAIDLRTVFQSFDSDASGTLSRTEFHKALAIVAPDLTADDVERLFDIVDIDKNQQISYTEFLVATLDPREVDIEELNKAFRLLDEDGNGVITKDEMRKVIRSMLQQALENSNINPSDLLNLNTRHNSSTTSSDYLEEEVDNRVNAIFEQADLDHDGTISYDEFLMAMTGGVTSSTTASTAAAAARNSTSSYKTSTTLLSHSPSQRSTRSSSQRRNSPAVSPMMQQPLAGSNGGVPLGGGEDYFYNSDRFSRKHSDSVYGGNGSVRPNSFSSFKLPPLDGQQQQMSSPVSGGGGGGQRAVVSLPNRLQHHPLQQQHQPQQQQRVGSNINVNFSPDNYSKKSSLQGSNSPSSPQFYQQQVQQGIQRGRSRSKITLLDDHQHAEEEEDNHNYENKQEQQQQQQTKPLQFKGILGLSHRAAMVEGQEQFASSSSHSPHNTNKTSPVASIAIEANQDTVAATTMITEQVAYAQQDELPGMNNLASLAAIHEGGNNKEERSSGRYSSSGSSHGVATITRLFGPPPMSSSRSNAITNIVSASTSNTASATTLLHINTQQPQVTMNALEEEEKSEISASSPSKQQHRLFSASSLLQRSPSKKKVDVMTPPMLERSPSMGRIRPGLGSKGNSFNGNNNNNNGGGNSKKEANVKYFDVVTDHEDNDIERAQAEPVPPPLSRLNSRVFTSFHRSQSNRDLELSAGPTPRAKDNIEESQQQPSTLYGNLKRMISNNALSSSAATAAT